MSILQRLTGAAYGTHLADQIALVSVPLVAVLVFDAPPQIVGILVACQSMAHLLGSIPFGILVDQKQLRTLAIVSALTSLVGSVAAATSILFGGLFWFGIAITLAGFGTVLFGLTALSALPRVVGSEGLARANAGIEIPRAMCSFAVPLVVGLAIGGIPAWAIFVVAAGGSVFALLQATALPVFEVSPKPAARVFRRILEGGRYVAGHRLLLPISLCAVFWNFAFAALLVVLVAVIGEVYRFAPGSFGLALSAFGLAAISGSWLAGRIAHRIAPSILLLFGPGSSVIAAGGLLVIGPNDPEASLYACFFLLGFGPSMWLITQNAVRQIVTPRDMLGRVNAVIQTAIYGMRPVGAVIGGLVAGTQGPQAGLVLVVLAFGASFAVALFSGLRTVVSYEAIRMRAAA